MVIWRERKKSIRPSLNILANYDNEKDAHAIYDGQKIHISFFFITVSTQFNTSIMVSTKETPFAAVFDAMLCSSIPLAIAQKLHPHDTVSVLKI